MVSLFFPSETPIDYVRPSILSFKYVTLSFIYPIFLSPQPHALEKYKRHQLLFLHYRFLYVIGFLAGALLNSVTIHRSPLLMRSNPDSVAWHMRPFVEDSNLPFSESTVFTDSDPYTYYLHQTIIYYSPDMACNYT